VAAEILTDFPGRLADRQEVWLADGQSAPRRVRLLSCRMHLGQAIFCFEGVQTISEARALRGLEVQIPFEERAPLAAGRYYISDLVGCQVWEEGASAPLGVVQDVHRAGEEQGDALPEASFLVVDVQGSELLIPLAAEICTRIDIATKRIDVRLPEGLRDLNAL
jgi:16S rRNA processing protein RimM